MISIVERAIRHFKFALGVLFAGFAVPLASASVAAAASPSIESESVSGITTTDATLNAAIEPRSGRNVVYQFQLAKDPSEFAEEIQCPPSPSSGPFLPCVGTESATALPIGQICGECEIEPAQPVNLDLATAGITLEPNTTYYFRVLAADQISSEDTIEWESPAVLGATEEFTTPAEPSVESESSSHISTTEATLEAEVNPNGLETEYEFWIEYLVCQNPPPGSGACWAITAKRVDKGTIPAGHGGQAISTTLDDLSPGYTYSYWVVASNAAGEDEGSHQEFTTLNTPSVESESASNITMTDATLEAEVNLHEVAAGARYQFQLVSDPGEYVNEILCPPTLQPGLGCIGPQGSGALPIGFLPGNTMQPSATSHASLELASAGVSLQPATTYHYRVLVARNVQTEDTIQWEEPTVFGADQTFTTSSESSTSNSQPDTKSPPPVNDPPSSATASSSPSVTAARHRRHRHHHRHGRHHRHKNRHH